MIDRNDIQWWAGALGAGIAGVALASVLPHPYDAWAVGLAAFCGGFALYKITPAGSSKD